MKNYKNAFDSLSQPDSCLEIGFDGPKLQGLLAGFQMLIQRPQQSMEAMDDLLPEQESPGLDRVHVQRIIVAG